MEFETKILSKGIQEMLYNSDKTVGTAESCTGGRIAEALISVPGASNYFKGGVVSYTNEVKENLLGVSHEVLEEKTAYCEEVAREMVLGAIKALNVTGTEEYYGYHYNLKSGVMERNGNSIPISNISYKLEF